MAKWNAPAEEPEPAKIRVKPARPAAQATMMFVGELVCVTVGDEPVAQRSDGVCNCGACESGRHPDSAADYF